MTVKPNELEEKVIVKNRYQIAEENAKGRVEQLHKLINIDFVYELEVSAKTDVKKLKAISNAIVNLVNQTIDEGTFKTQNIKSFKYYDKDSEMKDR